MMHNKNNSPELQQVANILMKKYPWYKHDFDQDWLSNNHVYRYLISCITVAGSAEDRTFAACKELFKHYDMYELSKASYDEVNEILKKHDVSYSERKTKFVIETSEMLIRKFNGQVPDTREKLEQLPGVSRHIASVILATLHDDVNVFAVDYHVRRIFKRLGWLEKGSDKKYEKFVEENINKNISFGHLSRAFVCFGQDICTKRPRCNICPLKSICPSFNTNDKTKKKDFRIDRNLFEVFYVRSKSDIDKEYAITIRDGDLSCSCKHFRFKKHCKHIDQVKKQVAQESKNAGVAKRKTR